VKKSEKKWTTWTKTSKGLGFLVIRQTLLLISYKKAELYISKFVSNNDFFHNFYYNNYFYKKSNETPEQVGLDFGR